MDTKATLASLLNREVGTIETQYQGKRGYLPEYFDFSARNCVSQLFSTTPEGALDNLLVYLKNNKSGSDNGISTDG